MAKTLSDTVSQAVNEILDDCSLEDLRKYAEYGVRLMLAAGLCALLKHRGFDSRPDN